MNYKWSTKPKASDDIIEQLLINRGLTKREEQERFLNPDWERDTHDPMQFKQMEDAVDRVFLALESGEPIAIHGDYDADGVCGSALLFSVLEVICHKLGFGTSSISVFLPDRERDGYGVAMHTVERLVKEGVKLLITVDCGIANADQLEHAHELGTDVIICDHHQLAERLPKHAIILHPLAPGEDYPNKFLCGTGVAFKLGSALISHARKRGAALPEGYEKWFLDFVAIAMVTDVMPLLKENRTLEKFGLKVLNKSRRLGIRKIVELSRSDFGSIDTQAVGFQIGPRINAAGRVRSAKIAFNALVAKTEDEAQKYALELEMLNRERQRVSESAYKEARRLVHERDEAPIHVVWNETWLPGIVGLVAGKLVSEFGTPAFAFTKVGDLYVGSGRSIGGLHLVEAMRSCGDIFVKAGGHPQACGLSLASLDHVKLFKDKVTAFAKDFFGEEGSQHLLEIEAALSLDKVTWELFEKIEQFEPFGEKNPRPKFLARELQVLAAKAIGKTRKHLRLTINPLEGPVWKLIGFGLGDWSGRLSIGTMVDVVYEISVNVWNGKKELQCQIVDLLVRGDNPARSA